MTLATRCMAKSVEAYRSLCLELVSGGPRAVFSMFRVGGQYVHIVADSEHFAWAPISGLFGVPRGMAARARCSRPWGAFPIYPGGVR